MGHIEDTTPIDVLASRVWAGTRYAYPHIEQMANEMRELRARAEKAEALYAKAWEETQFAREVLAAWKSQREYENKNNIVPGGCVSCELEVWCVRYINAKRAHDAARKEAGL